MRNDKKNSDFKKCSLLKFQTDAPVPSKMNPSLNINPGFYKINPYSHMNPIEFPGFLFRIF